MANEDLQWGNKLWEVMEQWRKRIIDLTPRNPLLHSPPRRRRLAVIEPSPEQVWDLLLQDERALLLVPEDWTEKASALREEEKDLDWEMRVNYLVKQQWSRYTKARIACSAKDLFSALTRLRRRVRTLYEDAGFWTLFLACGLLRWSPGRQIAERSGPEIWESPLLLLPVNLEQKSPQDPFLLSYRPEAEVQFNLALRVYLEDVEKVSLPEVDPENLADSLKMVASAVQERGWKVEVSRWLNLFSFPKMAMYQDLRDNEDHIIEHPVVQALAGVPRRDLNVPISIDRNSLDSRPSQEIATVLPADTSQLEAVLLAREGKSFLVYGPPGTGKSQTIVNIIADALTRGKSVLFVSEKRAALEVVLRRLRDVGLEPFCLDLHDYRAKRGEVVKSIADEMTKKWDYKSAPPSRLPADLDLRRKALAEYVRAIHTPRGPLNRTPYQVIGRLNRLPALQVTAGVTWDGAGLTEESLAEIVHLADSLAPAVYIAGEGRAFPWTGVQVGSFSEQVRADLLSRVQGMEEALDSLASTLESICSRLGLGPPSSAEEAGEFYSLLEAFRGLPPLPPAWTQKPDVQDWLEQGRSALSDLKEFIETRERLSPFVDTALLPADKEAPLSAREARLLQEAVGSISSHPLLKEALGQPVGFLVDHWPLLRDLRTALVEAVRHADALRAELGLGRCMDLRDVDRTHILAQALCQNPPLEAEWLEREVPPEEWKRASRFLDLLVQRQDLRQRLLQEWKEDLLSLNAAEARDTWLRWHRSPFWFLSLSYWRLVRHLKQTCRDRKPPWDRVSQALQELQDLQTVEASLEAVQQEPGLARFLGRYYKGLDTNPEQTRNAIGLVQAVRNAFPGLHSQVRKLLSGQMKMSEKQAARVKDLLNSWNEWTSAAQELRLRKGTEGNAQGPIGNLIQDLKEAEDALERLAPLWERVTPLIKGGVSLTSLASFLDDLCRCLEAGERFRKVAMVLAEQWKRSPEADPKAWEQALSALEVWAGLVSRIEVAKDVPAPLARAGQDPEARPCPEHLFNALQGWERAFQALKERFNDPFPLVQGQTSFAAAGFSDLAEHLRRMRVRVEEVQRYLDFQRFRDALAERLSPSVIDALVNDTSLSPEDLPKAVERIVLARWLDWVFASDPVLRDFRWEYYQQNLEEFRRLDKDLQRWASARTVQELQNKRESLIETHPDVQIILREARKRRRHLPIRRVIRETFHTIQKVKPCWLMSPLSVSHFLRPEHRFDLVIFDEASQVRPEDAIPAIYRAKQVIICGDPKQLPPTAFFQARVLDTVLDAEEPDGEEEAAYRPEGESVLECLEGKLPRAPLRWHYRSKDESLIAFSNYYIYNGELITFPTPRVPGWDTGIEYRYLPNAVYERSGRRVNQAEVEKVCRLVLEHSERWGTSRTLGVVTMNEPQRDAVLDELERRSTQDSRLRVLWDETAWPDGETFFVKNLEAVQGDERDVIIISTTYGKGPDGRLTMQFGPLTQTGGEYRLNVLVTRAREKIILVTSLQPDDLRLPEGSDRAGLRLLQAYLRYARDSILPLEPLNDGPTGWAYESDFEASVADVLRSWGYEVEPHYGVGPYRIDLAIRDPLDPRRVQVAVECDGATYHRLPTVRERDHIRQKWLERQGWKVVRVWSTDWWYQRRQAEERLRREVEDALEKARAKKGSNLHCRRRPAKGEDADPITLVATPIRPTPDLRTRLLEEKKVEVYQPSTYSPWWGLFSAGMPRIADPKDPSTVRQIDEIPIEELEALLRVATEALVPCRREDLLKQVADLLGFRRLGKGIRARLESVLDELIDKKVLQVDSQDLIRLT